MRIPFDPVITIHAGNETVEICFGKHRYKVHFSKPESYVVFLGNRQTGAVVETDCLEPANGRISIWPKQ